MNPDESLREIQRETIVNFIKRSGVGDVINANDPKVIYWLDEINTDSIAKIKALVVESLPKEHECTKDCNINSNVWRRGHLAYKDGLKAGLGEIRSIFE